MTLSVGPNLGMLVHGALGEAHYDQLLRQWRALDTLIQCNVISMALATPPGSPADGDTYIVAASPTGAWAGKATNLARWSAVLGAWEFFAPKEGWKAYCLADDGDHKFDGTTWVVAGGGSGTGIVESIVAGTGVTVDDTDPANPVISATGGGSGTGIVESIVAGTGVTVDDTDPANPVISASGGGGASGGLSFSQGQTAPGLVLTNGDKTVITQPYLSGFRLARSQSFKSSGSWYFEVRCVAITSATSSVVGLSGPNYPLVSNGSAEALPGYSFCRGNGQIFYNNGSFSPTGLAFASGDVVGIMLNADAGWMKIVKNGVPSSDGPIVGGGAWAPCVGFESGASSGSFEILTTPVYAVPSGFTYWT